MSEWEGWAGQVRGAGAVQRGLRMQARRLGCELGSGRGRAHS